MNENAKTGFGTVNLKPYALVLSVLAFCTFLKLCTLGYPAISDPSEGRYAAIGQEMARSGDWVTQQTDQNGATIPFLAKPPLHAWLTAVSMKAFGVNEFAARLPSFLSCVGMGLLTGYFALVFLGSDIALLAVLFFSSSVLCLALSGGCLTDPVLGFCITGTLASFAFALEHPLLKRRKQFGYAFFVFLGLGMLTKGPVAIAVSGIALFAWLVVADRFYALKQLPWVTGTVLFLLVWVPWYAAAEASNPGFLRYFFVNENLLRFLVKDYGDRYGTGHRYPYGAIWVMLLISFFPWSVMPLFDPSGFKQLRERTEEHTPWLAYAFFWALAPVLLFTPARQISLPYVLPALPGIALVFAVAVQAAADFGEEHRMEIFLKANTCFSAAFGIAVLIVGVLSHADIKSAAFGGIVFVLFFVLAAVFVKSRPRTLLKLAALSASSTSLMFTVFLLCVHQRLDRDLSAKDLTAYLNDAEPHGTTVGFLQKTPHSAYFYARKAGGIKIELISSQDLNSTELPYLAVRNKDVKQLGNAFQRYRMLKDFGQWVVFKLADEAVSAHIALGREGAIPARELSGERSRLRSAYSG